MGKTRLLTGTFMCPDCDEEFELDRAKKDEAKCDDCKTPLEEVDDDEDEEEEDEEEED